MSFSYIDTSPKKAVIRDKASTNPKSRFYHVSPCVLGETECTYKTREKARQTHQQGYNSVLQVEESYLKTRNRNENFASTNHKYMTQKLNIEEGKFTENTPKVEKRQSISGALSPNVAEVQNITEKIGNALKEKLGISVPGTG